jgi:hypothetical protein
MRRVVLATLGTAIVVLLPAAPSSATAAPLLPAWVKQGLVVEYVDNLGGYVDYDYTDTVTSRAHGVVDVTTHEWSPGLAGTDKNLEWSCSAACSGIPASTSAQFWVDTANPSASLRSAAFAYKDMGVVNFVLRGVAWKALLLYCPTTHGPVTSYFQASTGLFLYHKEYGYSYTYHVWYPIQISYLGTQHA